MWKFRDTLKNKARHIKKITASYLLDEEISNVPDL
jgi:hypothetical protein